MNSNAQIAGILGVLVGTEELQSARGASPVTEAACEVRGQRLAAVRFFSVTSLVGGCARSFFKNNKRLRKEANFLPCFYLLAPAVTIKTPHNQHQYQSPGAIE